MWDWRSIFTGVPDGCGNQEDPGVLHQPYREYEHTCFDRTSPLVIAPLRAWFPLGNMLEYPKIGGSSRWGKFVSLMERYRFCSAGLCTLLALDSGEMGRIRQCFEQMPPWLQESVFGCRTTERPELRSLFRMAMRISWQQLNHKEVVLAVSELPWEPPSRRVSAEDLSPQAIEALEKLDFGEEASRTSYHVRSLIREERSNRASALVQALSRIQASESILTAYFKAVTDPANRR